ncbi:MAG: NMD3-related protein [Candidatus Woesearchaeota archaeon]
MVIIKDSFQVELEMEQKMSPISKKMHDDYYECRVQFRLYFYNKEDINKKLNEIEQTYLLYENKATQTIYSNKDIKYNEILISEYDLAYFKLKYILRNVKLLINKIEDNLDGFDIYLANINDIHKLKRVINEHFFCIFTHSKKIMGRNKLKGKDLYRHSLLAAIYNLKPKDIVQIKGIKYTIKSIQKQYITAINEENKEKQTFHFNIIKDYLFKL